MDVKDFLIAGYKQYEVGVLESYWADTFLQKKVSDNMGIRYFINVYFGKPHSGEMPQPTAIVQFGSGWGTVDSHLSGFFGILVMEQFFQQQWSKMGYGYYEKYA